MLSFIYLFTVGLEFKCVIYHCLSLNVVSFVCTFDVCLFVSCNILPFLKCLGFHKNIMCFISDTTFRVCNNTRMCL